ncbi:hypothetical protein SLS62_000165 [Diatrype stigma]|uniref:Calcium channel subunit cch1 n=1 Tax=Diatrype stigma TaxID=117547 RepID=A0AAN9YX18_9PEZI
MHGSRFQTIRHRFSRSSLRSSFLRRSSTASASSEQQQSTRSRSDSSSSTSSSLSPASRINAVLSRQSSVADFEEEQKLLGPELSLLEPRPIVYWGGMEERMGSFDL